jgi:hypothetical protein
MTKALNGTQLAEKHLATLEDWMAKVTPAELVDLVNTKTGKLQREKTAKAIGFPKKNLTDKKTLSGPVFLKFEEKHITGKLEHVGNKYQPKSVDKSADKIAYDASEVPRLQQRIVELESQLAALQNRFGRFSELVEVYDEMAEI